MVSDTQRVIWQHFNITLVPLGPFDGRVAAIHTQHPDYYITTPNQEEIIEPPGPCNVYARWDGRYGPDDHTQWPQPFSRSYPYLCCVPKKNGVAAEYSIMWWDPTQTDFEPVQRHGSNEGIGFLPHYELRQLGQCCERLNERVDSHQARIDHNTT